MMHSLDNPLLFDLLYLLIYQNRSNLIMALFSSVQEGFYLSFFICNFVLLHFASSDSFDLGS